MLFQCWKYYVDLIFKSLHWSNIEILTLIQCWKYYVDPIFKSNHFHNIDPTSKDNVDPTSGACWEWGSHIIDGLNCCDHFKRCDQVYPVQPNFDYHQLYTVPWNCLNTLQIIIRVKYLLYIVIIISRDTFHTCADIYDKHL